MTATDNKRATGERAWKYREFTLTSGTKAFQGAAVCIALGTGKVVPASAAPNLLYIGTFAEDCDATDGDRAVNVDLVREISLLRWSNDTVAPVTQLDLGGLAYFIDDQTVSREGTTLAGRVWRISDFNGVSVQKLEDR